MRRNNCCDRFWDSTQLSAINTTKLKGGPPLTAVGLEALHSVIERLDYAFQPVVNVATGQCFGYEALLRNHDQMGFATQRAFFDVAAKMGALAQTQLQLWERAVAKFSSFADPGASRLFLNLDERSLDGGDILPHHIRGLLSHYDIPESAVTFEVSAPPPGFEENPRDWVLPMKRGSWKLAVDHLGRCEGGLSLIYAAEPDFVKISPFFIRGLHGDARKKLLLSQAVAVAHLLGILVVAVGVETDKDFLACREIGCDLVQGFLISGALMDPTQFPASYPVVEELARSDRRVKHSDHKLILDQMEPIEPLRVDAEVTAVFERLGSETDQTFVPIVDQMDQPLGIVRESNIKNYAYSPFGKDLISNKGLGRKLRDFIVRCPIAEVHTPVENIMSIYSGDEKAEGIILVNQMRYVGFLSARSIIRVINEKSLALARDQNPLTKLPGNALINQYVNDSLADTAQGYVYAYVDFDNFKPFNDKYGFRQGDRAILLFAELMGKSIGQEHFLGHIGGDDFFIGFHCLTQEQAQRQVRTLLEAFRRDAESFYDTEARASGQITALDREGNLKTFPLLSASAALVTVDAGRGAFTVDEVSSLIARLKKQAKHSPDKLASDKLA